MNIDLMRKVDYFAGIPLCLVATLWTRLMGWLWNDKVSPPKKVLFIELSEMGSAILADPAMRKMQRDGKTELYFLIFKSNAVSLRLLDTVPERHIFTINEDGFLNITRDSLRFLFWARRHQIDTVIDLELFSRYSALLTGLSGAVNRVGFHAFHNEGLYRGAMLTHRVMYNPHRHIAKNFIALVNAALAKKVEHPFSKTVVDDSEITLAQARVDEGAITAMRAKILKEYPGYDATRHRLVIINPNASDLLPQRRWMQENFVVVMRNLLADDENILVLITGSPAERDRAAVLQKHVNSDRCINFAGCHGLDALPALYQMAELMLTNDSGPGHFSAVTPLRTFVLFGPETPLLYGSLGNSTPIYAGLACSPCVSAANHRKTPCADNVCLQVIKPEAVLVQLRQALAENKSAQAKPHHADE
ncbi:glycosyl transferase [Rugosibacter aromaticivorans]|uniref:Glycosyl transferase n=1 Tax=Rugosibacter aromaticivorans TaxID=1565605 RepID=A0A0C5JLP9_9PROT|nr:glycosyltransferase family 9 protein [Rugosibacter aromaticivorans]AJP48326.1 glycosyl transferase [Rugosibacter aromaticivorans]TBR15879.1 MAG: glycosyltransferase family 9 protein [Rugosibacter sp.]